MCFSVNYYDAQGILCAINWQWPSPESRWSVSDRESASWQGRGLLTPETALTLLERFGLLGEEIPLAELIRLSPQELIRRRRALEKAKGLERLEVVSDTLGDHISAEAA